MSMSVSSQDQPFQLFNCKWAWCRLTFSDNAGLVRHVLNDHVRCAIPVRRRDISMIKRAEEGKGESFKISELMVDMYSYTSRESISHKPVEHPQEPSLSLPSPPVSSPALPSPHHLVHSPRPTPLLSPPLPLEWELSQHAEEYPTSDPISQSQSDSHHHLENLPVMSEPPSRLQLDPSAPLPNPPLPLEWELSQHVEKYTTSDPISQSQSDSHHHLENLPVMSEPPSRLRLDPSAVSLNSPPPASSPIFAVSTPLRQNWYQPPLKRRKRSTCNDKDSGPLQTTPASSSEGSKGKHAIVDALPANRLATPPTRPHSPCDLSSHSTQDSSDLSEINSYPALQTQAPYQSQILTQF